MPEFSSSPESNKEHPLSKAQKLAIVTELIRFYPNFDCKITPSSTSGHLMVKLIDWVDNPPVKATLEEIGSYLSGKSNIKSESLKDSILLFSNNPNSEETDAQTIASMLLKQGTSQLSVYEKYLKTQSEKQESRQAVDAKRMLTNDQLLILLNKERAKEKDLRALTIEDFDDN
jgi:hypothetical protein